MTRIAFAVSTSIITAIAVAGCSQSPSDWMAINLGSTPFEQLTPHQRKLKLEQLNVACIGYVYDYKAKAAGEQRGTVDECMEKSGFNRLQKLDQEKSASAAPVKAERSK
ncbi:MAG: hypothetical protein ABL901_02165 [Hyphomicrobiaceae bacterium]